MKKVIPLGLILCMFRVDCTLSQCDSNRIQVQSYCYLIIDDKLTNHDEARSLCASEKSRLPEFNDRQEYEQFEAFLKQRHPNLRVALGIEVSITDQDETIAWTASGRSIGFSNWENGGKVAPNRDPGKVCVERSDRGWTNVLCGEIGGSVVPVCQQGLLGSDGSTSRVPCALVHRLNAGWTHVITTNPRHHHMANFHINETNKLDANIALYASTIQTPGSTVPLYALIGPRSQSNSQVSMVIGEENVARLVRRNNYTIRSILMYLPESEGFGRTITKPLVWSFDPPTDTVVAGIDQERERLIADWGWKEMGDLYFFTKIEDDGTCVIERNCTLTNFTEWADCSTTCDPGWIQRNRSVLLPALGIGTCPNLTEYAECKLADCPLRVEDLQTSLEEAGILDSLSDSASKSASIGNTMPGIIVNETGGRRGLEMGHQLEDTIGMCMFADTDCDMDEDFETVVNPYMGNCFTFNPMNSSTSFEASRGGPHGGLRLLLSVQQSEYLCATETVGFKVQVHPKSEYAFVETFGQNIAPGTVTSMALTMTSIAKIDTGLGRNRCVNSLQDPKYPTVTYYYAGEYTTEGCLRSCIQDYVIRACDCADPRYQKPHNVSFCEEQKARCPDYYQNVTCVEDYQSKIDCPCHSPCAGDQYDAMISTSLLRSDMDFDKCNSSGCPIVSKHQALLEIYFDRIQMYQFTEEPAIDIMFLLSDVSGMTGNINGFCIITIFECGFLLAEILAVWCASLATAPKDGSNGARKPFWTLLAETTSLCEFVCFCLAFVVSLFVITLLYVFKVIGG